MDHAEARDRLAAAAEAARAASVPEMDTELAAHLAVCAACAAEAAAWERTVAALVASFAFATDGDAAQRRPAGEGPRDARGDGAVVGAAGEVALPPDLRARTLAFVAERGRARGPVAMARGPVAMEGSASVRARAALPGQAPAPVEGAAYHGLRRRAVVARVLALVATVVVLVGGSGLIVDLGQQRDGARAEARQMAWVTASLGAILREPGHLEATLVRQQTGAPAGAVAWGPASGELAVVSDALPPPPPGTTYRCWIEHGGIRVQVGEMEFGEGVAYWVGPVGKDGIPAGSTFGVSLASMSGGVSTAPPVLLGTF